MVAGGRCVAVRGTAERLPLSAKVPTRYTADAKCCCERPATVGEALECCPSWQAGGAAHAVARDGRTVSVVEIRETHHVHHHGSSAVIRARKPQG